MSVSIDNGTIVLAGHASVEEAEILLSALKDHPDMAINVLGLTRAHLAVVQLLHASGRPVEGEPSDPFLRDHALSGLIQIKPDK